MDRAIGPVRGAPLDHLLAREGLRESDEKFPGLIQVLPEAVPAGADYKVALVKNVERSLRDSEEKYLLLLNSAAEAILGLDLAGKCTFCNPASIRLLGYKAAEDLLGKNIFGMMNQAHGEISPAGEASNIYGAFHEGKASHVARQILLRGDGTSVATEYWSYPMYRAGELVGAVATFLDISDRVRAEQALRQSEEKYRNLFENATCGIFRSSRNGAFLDVNPALVAMLGYSSKKELIVLNLDLDIYLDPQVPGEVLEKCELNRELGGEEVKWKRRDGKIIDVRLTGRMIYGGQEKTDSIEFMVEDVTERRDLEEQFRQAQKMETLGLLAGGISHDFNNLLSVILGNAELLLDKTQFDEQQRFGEEIRKATRRATQLTQQLLTFSRKQTIDPTVLDVNAIVQDLVKILRHLLREDVRIVTELETGLGPIRFDRGRMEQTLMNLATNARDAMPDGGEFTLRTRNIEIAADTVIQDGYVRPGRYVQLTVSDTGVGMNDAVRSRIFELFFTTKPPGGGTGLGLAAVHGMVKQSGGYTLVSSAPGAGTTFDLYLPRVDETVPPLLADTETRREYPGGTEAILLLEDEDSLRKVLCEFLTASGYTVLEAGSGAEALAMAEERQGAIPLIISDVVLPDMSGPAVVARLKRFRPEVQALYMSGYSEAPAARQLIADGAFLMEKPLTRRELLGKVDEMLHLRRLVGLSADG